MSSTLSPLLFTITITITITVVITTVSAAEFQVGNAVGWRTPATNESQLYNVWASRRHFHIGDSLRFRYKNNSVAVVEKWGYYHCDSSNPIAFFDDGDTLINLDIVCMMHFISGDSDRCKKGVNMMVEVMTPSPVIYIPPAVAIPPEDGYAAVAPSPSQFLSSVDSPESFAGDSSSDSLSSFLVFVSVTAIVAGVGLFVLIS